MPLGLCFLVSKMKVVVPTSRGRSGKQMCKNGSGLCKPHLAPSPPLLPGPCAPSRGSQHPGSDSVQHCWGREGRPQGPEREHLKLPESVVETTGGSVCTALRQTRHSLQAVFLPLPRGHPGALGLGTSAERAVAWLGRPRRSHQGEDSPVC